MPPISARETRFYACLREGDLAEAERLMARGVSLSEKDPEPTAQEKARAAKRSKSVRPTSVVERFLRAASFYHDSTAADWLIAKNPALTPSAEHAANLLKDVLRGTPYNPNLWFANWLVQHSPLGDQLRATDVAARHRIMAEWMSEALCRRDIAGVQWLLHPPSGFPVWQEDPQRPILTQVMKQHTIGSNLGPVPSNVSFLVQQGVRAHVAPDLDDLEKPITSPLQHLLDRYEHIRSWSSSYNAEMKSGIEAAVIQLWPVLVHAGDDPERLLKDGRTLRDMIRKTPAGSVAVAWERLQELPPAPVVRVRRSRLRS
jgi:hypothetical protein